MSGNIVAPLLAVMVTPRARYTGWRERWWDMARATGTWEEWE